MTMQSIRMVLEVKLHCIKGCFSAVSVWMYYSQSLFCVLCSQCRPRPRRGVLSLRGKMVWLVTSNVGSPGPLPTLAGPGPGCVGGRLESGWPGPSRAGGRLQPHSSTQPHRTTAGLLYSHITGHTLPSQEAAVRPNTGHLNYIF